VRNGLIANSTLTLAGDRGGSRLNFQGAQTLGGTGQIVFATAGSGNSIWLSEAVTIGAGLTIRGGPGRIEGGTGALSNEGTILADGASQMPLLCKASRSSTKASLKQEMAQRSPSKEPGATSGRCV